MTKLDWEINIENLAALSGIGKNSFPGETLRSVIRLRAELSVGCADAISRE